MAEVLRTQFDERLKTSSLNSSGTGSAFWRRSFKPTYRVSRRSGVRTRKHTKKVPVDTKPATSLLREFDVLLHRRLEQLLPPCIVDAPIVHTLHPRIALTRDNPNSLRPALVEPARRRRLVRRTRAPRARSRKQARIRKLHDHLRPRVGADAELLRRGLSVRRAHETDDVVVNERADRCSRSLHLARKARVERPVQRLGERGRRACRCAHVEVAACDHVEDGIAERDSRRAVHHGVLAHDTRLAVVVDDELDGLVDPAIAEAEERLFAILLAVATVPEGGTVLDEIVRGYVVEREHESSRLDCFYNVNVIRILLKCRIVLGSVQLCEPSTRRKSLPLPRYHGQLRSERQLGDIPSWLTA